MVYLKKYFSLWLILLLTALYSCSSSDPEVQPELIVAKEELTLAKGSGTTMLAIKTNVNWTATSSQSWCTLSPSSGEAGTKQITVAATENTTNDTREAVITVTAGSLSKQIKVTQELTNLLVVKKSTYDVSADGGQITVELQTTAAHTVTINQDWISQTTTRTVTNKTEVFTIANNASLFSRVGTITFTMAGLIETVTINQAAKNLFIAADKTGMESDAFVLAKKIYLGWNLGNTLECTSSTTTGSVISGETDWGNAKASKAMINAVKAAGFNAVRIPCAWNRYLENSTNYKIKDFWLARVKEVVDYCVSNDMYAIINIHSDGGWLDNNPTLAKQEEVTKKEKAIWEQIAVYFRNYDEHLLFAGTNEVNMGSNGGTPTQDNYNVQMSYNQTFVDAVRSTGGRNAYRNLLIQAFSTDINQAVSNLKVSTDKVQNRLMVEVHYYDPSQFCILESDATWGKYFVFWGADYHQYATGALAGRAATWGEEDHVISQFAKMKTNFIDKGYPVILGEYSPTRRLSLTGDALTHHLDSRAYYIKYVTEQAKNYGIVPFYWDNGGTGDKGCGIFNRSTTVAEDTKALNGLVQGAAAGKYPF
ncbi:endoglucanase [Bacteroides luti]|uniref:Endoglucanase n=1 Tax=Bacteroides luti TaxID=1297750 RepID=A0A1M4Z2J3_9BACE|nr:cellulase family glycosylhydrolase [Bacteroides luti]SHF12230.1 endoglucanase [Bacteroides luti]